MVLRVPHLLLYSPAKLDVRLGDLAQPQRVNACVACAIGERRGHGAVPGGPLTHCAGAGSLPAGPARPCSWHCAAAKPKNDPTDEPKLNEATYECPRLQELAGWLKGLGMPAEDVRTVLWKLPTVGEGAGAAVRSTPEGLCPRSTAPRPAAAPRRRPAACWERAPFPQPPPSAQIGPPCTALVPPCSVPHHQELRGRRAVAAAAGRAEGRPGHHHPPPAPGHHVQVHTDRACLKCMQRGKLTTYGQRGALCRAARASSVASRLAAPARRSSSQAWLGACNLPPPPPPATPVLDLKQLDKLLCACRCARKENQYVLLLFSHDPPTPQPQEAPAVPGLHAAGGGP